MTNIRQTNHVTMCALSSTHTTDKETDDQTYVAVVLYYLLLVLPMTG